MAAPILKNKHLNEQTFITPLTILSSLAGNLEKPAASTLHDNPNELLLEDLRTQIPLLVIEDSK